MQCIKATAVYLMAKNHFPFPTLCTGLYTKKSKTHKQFFYLGAKCWNMLPQPLRQVDDAKTFSHTLKSKLLQSTLIDKNYTVNNTYDHVYKFIE